MAPICIGCKHLTREPGIPALLDGKCGAFPAGIPNEILLSKVDHRLPFAGDNGIRYEPEDEEAAKYADFMFDWRVPVGDSAQRPT